MVFNGGHYRMVILIRVPARFGQWSKGRLKHDPLTDSESQLSVSTRARTKCLNCNEIGQEIYVSAGFEDVGFRCALTSEKVIKNKINTFFYCVHVYTPTMSVRSTNSHRLEG